MASYPGETGRLPDRAVLLLSYLGLHRVTFCITAWHTCSPTRTRRQERFTLKFPFSSVNDGGISCWKAFYQRKSEIQCHASRGSEVLGINTPLPCYMYRNHHHHHHHHRRRRGRRCCRHNYHHYRHHHPIITTINTSHLPRLADFFQPHTTTIVCSFLP